MQRLVEDADQWSEIRPDLEDGQALKVKFQFGDGVLNGEALKLDGGVIALCGCQGTGGALNKGNCLLVLSTLGLNRTRAKPMPLSLDASVRIAVVHFGLNGCTILDVFRLFELLVLGRGPDVFVLGTQKLAHVGCALL